MVLRLCAFVLANAAMAAGAAERPSDLSDAPAAIITAPAYAPAMTGGSASAAAGTVVAQLARQAPARGALLAGPTLVPIDVVTDTIDKLEPSMLRSVLKRRDGLLKITGEPRCTISIHSLRYQTVGGQGEPTDAGAVIMAPSGKDPACNGPRPVMLYAHGTVLDKTFSMARLNGEARLVAAMFVAQGYVVVAPDYAGYGVSSLPYHPYLNADQQSADMVDALRAARAAYGVLGLEVSQRLFLTGYSQGGFVALATQRAIQQYHADEFKVTAAAGLSGPYALAQMADDIFSGRPSTGVTSYLPLLTTSGQRAGAALYAAPEDLYEARYAEGIESLLPTKIKLDDLVNKGKLPKGALFAHDSQPQAADASAFFADRNLVRTSYRNAYLQDMAAHPCRSDAAEPLACAPEHGLRKWMVKNDLRSYVPQTPLLLCGGARDPVVPFSNAESAAAYFNGHGARAVLVDLETIQPQDAYLAQKQGFAHELQVLAQDAAKKGNDPGKAVSDRYHSRLAASFCLMTARDFFNSASP
ncbi:prolyl oligopeptidase family serine peptidase [Duganella sp. FT92W]|uniref:Prolyl oligopeptidase family serine peptidase n=1 Tax=Pseudoduganella rivuli TaxID=2666085 RepID=A0A7X2LTL1_9BURK|nr:alpha/beta hydrolase [Pseudoduganella rivuli]MRV73426.1 prolyl oligopeptidase family serine peptidase [Pseudoduganella rivuli]